MVSPLPAKVVGTFSFSAAPITKTVFGRKRLYKIAGMIGKMHIEIRGMIDISSYKIQGMEEKYLKYSHNQFIFIVFVPLNHCWIWKDAFLKEKYMPRCLNGSSKMTVVAP